MNGYLVSAAGIAFLGGVVHSGLGERIFTEVLPNHEFQTIFGDSLFIPRTLLFSWHFCTVAWWAMAVLLIYFSMAPPGPASEFAVGILAITYLANSLLTLLIGRGRHPAWIAFLVTACLAWFGA